MALVKSVRLQDIARRADVSVAAVSMALADHPGIGDDTKRRIRQIARQLGYRPRGRVRRPAPGAVRRVGVALVGERLASEANTEFLSHAMALSAAGGFRVEVAAIEEITDRAVVRNFLVRFAAELDAMLLVGPVTADDVAAVRAAGVACVVLGHVLDVQSSNLSFSDTPAINRMSSDELAMGRRAAAWLLEQGHRRIGFVCEQLLPGFCHHRWLDGYRLALHDAGLMPNTEWVHESGQAYSGGAPAAAYFADMKERPTAYVLPDARIAASFLEAMRERGHAVAADAVVCGGTSHSARQYGIAHLPRIEPDIAQFAAASLRRLFYLRDHPDIEAVEILVPFVAHNFPPGAEEKSNHAH